MKLDSLALNSPSFRRFFPILAIIVFSLSAFESPLFADPPPQDDEDACGGVDAPLPGSGQHSPRTVISTPFGTSYQVNVDVTGQNTVGDAANEPSICLDPNNPNRIAIGWRQFDTINSNFRQSGISYSTNGGLNWTFPASV